MRTARAAPIVRGFFAAILGVLGARSLAAAPVDVLTLDSTRTPNDFATSSGFSGARADLLNPSNFGPSGTVPRAVQSITAVPVITAASLSGIELVVLSNVTVLPTAAENSALSSFLSAGGGLLILDNNAAAILQPILGVTPGSFSSSGVGLVSNSAAPIVNGPFGALPTGTAVTTGFAGSFATGGLTPSGTEAITNDVGILAASFDVAGGGRVAAISDEEMFASAGFVGGNPHFGGGANETVFLDSVAYLVAVPEPSTLFAAVVACTALFSARPRGRRVRCRSTLTNG